MRVLTECGASVAAPAVTARRFPPKRSPSPRAAYRIRPSRSAAPTACIAPPSASLSTRTSAAACGLQPVSPHERPARHAFRRECFRENRAAGGDDLGFESGVLGRICRAEAVRDVGDRRRSGGEGAAMRGRVDAEREAADDRAGREGREIVGRSRARRFGRSRADDRRSRRALGRRERSENDEKRRRIAEIAQTRGIGRLVHRDDARTDGLETRGDHARVAACLRKPRRRFAREPVAKRAVLAAHERPNATCRDPQERRRDEDERRRHGGLSGWVSTRPRLPRRSRDRRPGAVRARVARLRCAASSSPTRARRTARA